MNFKLDYKGFEKYMIVCANDTLLGGISFRFRFENGYGASVIKNTVTYGDLWELGVIYFADESDESWNRIYAPAITEDIVGYLTDAGVRDVLDEIKNLPPVTKIQ